MERHIMHMNITSFYIAVAGASQPRLLSCPVAVATPGGTRRMLLDVSGKAAQAGLYKGMLLEAARRRCADLVVLDPAPDLYERASIAIAHEAGRLSPKVETAGAGNFFIDLTGTTRLWGASLDAADRLRRSIKDNLRLDSAVGLARNKLVSRVAARVVKPVGLCEVMAGGEADFMAPLPIGYLPGLTPDLYARLLQLNLRRIKDILSIPADSLSAAFGQRASEIRRLAQGVDDDPVRDRVAPAPSIQEEFIFEGQTNDDRTIESALFRLVSLAGFRLRAMRLAAGRIELSIRYADGVARQRSIRLYVPLDGDLGLYERFLDLLRTSYTRRVRLARISIRLEKLSHPCRQLDLFGDAERERKLMKALDSIKVRFGQDAITFCGR
jgi:DNA polymerase-4